MPKYTLKVPLDASEIPDVEPGQDVKVVLVEGKEVLQSKTVKLTRGRGAATFEFDKRPTKLRALFGPSEIDDRDLPGMQTLSTEITKRAWGRARTLTIDPVLIHPYYWRWWWRWCRTFTIHGQVLGQDQCPVPGAEVCAYDVDWWFYWKSTQQLGCTHTDDAGNFSLTFKWCCGWWPWWWWRLRTWEIDPSVVARIQPILERDPSLRLKAPGTQPNLELFSGLLADDGITIGRDLAADPTIAEKIREPLLRRLPVSHDLARLRIWPWYPWHPWRDCNPDVIFKVTQECLGDVKVIVDEDYSDTRWNIPTDFPVNLTANEDACCIPPVCQDPPCPEGECLVVDEVCGYQIDLIGGNQTPAKSPEGYLNPGDGVYPAGAKNLDRPFAGTVPVYRIGKFEVGGSVVVDYYEILDEALNPLPNGAEVDFCRTYWTGDILNPFKREDFDFQPMPGLPAGHRVVESIEHRGDDKGIADWRWSQNRDLLVPLDSTKFPADGTYRFKVRAWREVGGVLTNPTVLPLCDTSDDATFALTFDNRAPVPEPGHDASHNCGSVHVCTSEPDCHILEVRVDGHVVGECGTVDAANGDLEIDFMVDDPSGHLSHYDLLAYWGLNNGHSLTGLGAALTRTNPADPVFVGPTYGDAVNQGAAPPTWEGGRFTLTIPAATAFPVPCCYQLKLLVRKRTITGGKGSGCRFGCNDNWPHRNRTQFTVGVGVCPDEPIEPGGPIVIEPDLRPGVLGPGPIIDPRRGGGGGLIGG